MPPLPNAALASIDPRKITLYLLSQSHRVGRDKARFFTAFGFSTLEPEVFEAALLAHAAENEVVNLKLTPLGVKYEVEGPLKTPSGRLPAIRTVWIVGHGAVAPSFLTAFPA